MTAPEPPGIEAGVGRRGRLGIEAVTAGEDLSGPLYAVNLLDRRRPWAYELYGLLVIRPLLKTGARIVFKGHRRRVLLGAAAQTRETLLIVRYPGAEAFLNLVGRPSFAATSLFRRAGIAAFRFGFVRTLGAEPRVSERPRRYTGTDAYLLTTLRGGPPSLPAALATVAPGLFFAGRTVATVVFRAAGAPASRPSTLAPPLGWTGILLHQGSAPALEELAHGRLAAALSGAESAACVLYRRSL